MSGVERLSDDNRNAACFASYVNETSEKAGTSSSVFEEPRGMDLLHRPNEFNFISDEVNVREFYEVALKSQENFCDDVDKRKTQLQNDNEWFASLMGCDVSVAQEIAHVCDVERLRCPEMNSIDPVGSFIPNSSNLMTSEIQRRELEKRNTLSYKQMQAQLQKYKRFNFKLLSTFKENAENESVPKVYESPDVLLTIFMTRPYNKPLEKHEIRLGRLLTMDSVFYVLGSQKLTALRDKINCLSDWSVLEDYSENPDKSQNYLTMEVYKSGYFYINGTFYNDMRDSGSKDLSREVINWASRRPKEIGRMDQADMNETTFLDLTLRLGQPYLYLHQGTCEHLMIFTDMRLVHPADSQSINDYPMEISQKMKKRAACCICKVYTARWVAFEHELLPFDPGFFCDPCYRSFNYDESGKKICDFRAIPYFDRSVM